MMFEVEFGDFDLKLFELIVKSRHLPLKKYSRPLYDKWFQSSDLFDFATFPFALLKYKSTVKHEI